MAVIKIFKQLAKPIGFSANSKEFTEHFIIHLDDPKTKLEDIEKHPDYPIRFEKHENHPQYWCVDCKLDQNLTVPNIRSGRSIWSTVIPEAQLVDNKPKYHDDPTLRPVDIDWDIYSFTKTIRMAYSKVAYAKRTRGEVIRQKEPEQLPQVADVPITTTAGEPLFMQIQIECRVIKFLKNVVLLPEFMAKAGMYVNSDKLKISGIEFDPGELLACGLRVGKPNFAFGKVYYQFTWQFLVAPDEEGWTERRRNAGYHEKVKIWSDERGKEYPKFVSGVDGGVTEKTILRPIEIGPVYNRHFPSAPVLLTPEGRAFRAKGPNDEKDDIKTNTGEILTTESKTGQGITAKQWDEAELRFNVRLAIPFKKYFPLR